MSTKRDQQGRCPHCGVQSTSSDIYCFCDGNSVFGHVTTDAALRVENAALKAKCEELDGVRLYVHPMPGQTIVGALKCDKDDLFRRDLKMHDQLTQAEADLAACREELRTVKEAYRRVCSSEIAILANREEIAERCTTLTERNAALGKALTETCEHLEASSLVGICTLTKSIRAALARNREGEE